MYSNKLNSLRMICCTLLVLAISVMPANADTVSDWIQVMNDTVLAGGTNPIVTTRVTATVSASMFDALNGIERRYTPLHVSADAPRGASRRAAVIQAAYTVLVAFYPAQKQSLDPKREAALAALTDDAGSVSIARGVEWGKKVAEQILAWRATDGMTPAPPPYTGSTGIGQWRPTPSSFAPGAVPQFGNLTTWAIPSATQFRPAGPPALDSAAYAAALNEVKTMGRATGSQRTTDQTELSLFWNGNTGLFWNRIARQVAAQRGLSLSQESLLFATLNIAIADAGIATWNAKYYFSTWRPVTAIPLADQDGNPGTDVELGWTPLIGTPAHPEYPSGHSTLSGAAATVLAHFFGDEATFSVGSEIRPGVQRQFTNFSTAMQENQDARVFSGIHFRPACKDGSDMGAAVAHYVIQHAFQRAHGSGQ